ncbi:MAG: glycine-rich domain-containing protein [Ferruginibacter sp.]
MKMLSLLVCSFIPVYCFSQNVGIGTTAPTELLDVNGNVNVRGTIKANGSDGNANQVLMKNNNGVLSWGDLSQYKNFQTFTVGTSAVWTVPAGVTRIFVELWGGGGGGSGFGGGGGGGYIGAYFTVVPGNSITYTVGQGGNSGSSTTANVASSGTSSTASFGSITISALGGRGCILYSATNAFSGAGGAYSATSGFRNYYGIVGQDGQSNKIVWEQTSTTSFVEHTYGGRGGDGANSPNSGGEGAYIIFTGVISRYISPVYPGGVGGGGSGNYLGGPGIYYGTTGADGQVRIWY